MVANARHLRFHQETERASTPEEPDELDEPRDPYLDEMLRRLDEIESGEVEAIPHREVRPHQY